MLITFERVWAVGCFDVGRGLFVVPQHTTTTSWNSRPKGVVFEPVRGTPIGNVPKSGRIAPKKDFSNLVLVEMAGYTLAQAFQKGVPLFEMLARGYTPPSLRVLSLRSPFLALFYHFLARCRSVCPGLAQKQRLLVDCSSSWLLCVVARRKDHVPRRNNQRPRPAQT